MKLLEQYIIYQKYELIRKKKKKKFFKILLCQIVRLDFSLTELNSQVLIQVMISFCAVTLKIYNFNIPEDIIFI